MRSQDPNNQFQKFLETGKQNPMAIKPKEKVDTQSALRAKYPGIPLPTHRAIKTFSDKQRRAVKREQNV